jgi:exodeoxyribonuclease V alpha subunit
MLVPAYAATIHKSQGSEYPAVIIPVLTQHYAMLQRNLLYTGVTRGKRLVVLVGQGRRHRGAQCFGPAAALEAGPRPPV